MSTLERQALEYLNELIDSGREYPDAEWLAWCAFKAVGQERLQELYDSQP